MEKIETEKNLRDFLKSKGFSVNDKKHDNENGYDIVAIKDGYSFLIEFKKLEKRDNGVYRYGGEIFGDICVCSTEKGNLIFIVNEKTSMTKTARLVDMIDLSS
jgi:Holliday junction resolvase